LHDVGFGPHPLRRGELLLKEKEVKGIGGFWFFSWFELF
jgi:hypothetical protein